MFLRTMLVVSAGFVFPELGPIDARPPSAQAFVDFDVNRYGDKEIRVSTLNRLKQNLRNVLSRSPHLFEPFVRLALADALTYDASTQTGGSNASIRLVLAKRNESAAGGLGTEGGVSRLVEALKALEPIRSFIREVSWADTIAYAGVVALELTRGPRMRVQNGREDAPLQRQEQVWRSVEQLTAYDRFLNGFGDDASTHVTLDDICTLLIRAGLVPAGDQKQARHAGLLIVGALGELRRLEHFLPRAETLTSDREDGRPASASSTFSEDTAQVTYGQVRDDATGSKAVAVNTSVRSLTLGKERFGNQYLRDLHSRLQRGEPVNATEASIAADAETLKELESLAKASEKSFANAYADLYQRATLLGARYSRIDLEA
ncbi:hypothetical protein CCYA_CCYA12G3404 [Cyanidiococcus yangmingshanensis]|nr:hypothetical protein CCYA_CCYA12G3404 [Cyanidiococcus yangmingshanensis]